MSDYLENIDPDSNFFNSSQKNYVNVIPQVSLIFSLTAPLV